MSTNRNKVKNWAITFPQSGNVARKEFSETFPPADEIICAQELHEDGGFHLHLGISLKHGVSKSTLLKWIAKKYPNDFKRIDVQPTRSIHQWADYISKEDPDTYRVEKKRVKKYTDKDALKDVLLDAMVVGGLEREKRTHEKEMYILKQNYGKFTEDDAKAIYGVSLFELNL